MIDLTGKLVEVRKDFRARKYIVTFEINQDDISLETLRDEELKIKVARKKDTRSLDANSYFHILARKLSQALRISEAACKNHLIASYGQVELLDDEALIYKTNAPEDYMIEREEIHSKLIKITEEKGKAVYFYRIYRPTHTYNSDEFAKLLSGTVDECRIQGIETATPDELLKMTTLWGSKKHE